MLTTAATATGATESALEYGTTRALKITNVYAQTWNGENTKQQRNKVETEARKDFTEATLRKNELHKIPLNLCLEICSACGIL